LFKFAPSSFTRKRIAYHIIHESGLFLSLNSSGSVCTTSSAAAATNWQLQPFGGVKNDR
jgi:hypothetical protein